MNQNLIYPGKSADMIVRLKCKQCQHQGEAADFLRVNPKLNTCPQCNNHKDLILIMNNGKEIDLSKGKRDLSVRAYIGIFVIGALEFLVFKLASFNIFLIAFVIGLILMVVIVFKDKKNK